GKGEVANYLKTKGFIYYSLSDVLREEATKKNIEHTRINMIKLGTELRQKNGPQYFAEKINNKIKIWKKNLK
ncbi:AAA family ATPase, partial [candidate division TA06 bacterium]|nr:AAA family ATPase [candidate division TA06 bacterium]